MFFLGFIYSYYFHKDSQKNFEFTVSLDTSYKKDNIYYFYVWNSGKTTIYKEDVINESGSIEIYFDEGIYVEHAKITDVTSDYFVTSLFNNYHNVKIEFDFLRPNEGFTLLLKMVRPSNTYWHFEIKQRKDFLKFPRIIKARGRLSNLYLFNNLFSYLILVAWVCTSFLAGKIDFLNLKEFSDVLMAVITMGIVWFLIYITPILFQRIKAPRPPNELKLHFIEKKR